MAAPAADHLTSISARARSLISTLNLHYLPHESGYIGLLGTSPHNVTAASGETLAAQSHNYYMLTRTLAVNFVHWLEPDDTHVLVEGGPVEYFVFAPDGKAERFVLGRDFAGGEVPVVSVPGGYWKALRLSPGAEFALMVNVLSPQFTPERVRIGFEDGMEMEKWVARYKGQQEWASEKFLRGLIGRREGGSG